MNPFRTLCRLAQEASGIPASGLSSATSLPPRRLITDIDHANQRQHQVSLGEYEIPEFEAFATAKDHHDHALKRGLIPAAASCAVAMFDLATTPLERGIAYNAAGGVHKAMDNPLDARGNYLAALDRVDGNPTWVMAVQNNLARVAIRLDELDLARALSAAVLAHPRARTYRRAWANMNLGDVALRTNCLSDALVQFEQAAELFREAQSHRIAQAPTTEGASPEQMFALAHASFARARLGWSDGLADLGQIVRETIDDDPETALTALLLLAHLQRAPHVLRLVAEAAAAHELFEIRHRCEDLLLHAA